MKKLNFVLLFAVGLFFAGTQFATAQEEKKEEIKEEVEKTLDLDEVKKEESMQIEKEKTSKTVIETEAEIKKKPETPKGTEGEGRIEKDDLEDDDYDDDEGIKARRKMVDEL